MNTKSIIESRVEMTQLVLPEHTNALGTIFGGQIMSWVDTAAAICAFRHCRNACVTVSMDALHFISPVKLGHIVILRASVNYTGKTSMEIGVKVMSENPFTGMQAKTATAYLTFVAVNDAGQPVPVPQVLPENDEDKRRFEEGRQRRELRLKTAKR